MGKEKTLQTGRKKLSWAESGTAKMATTGTTLVEPPVVGDAVVLSNISQSLDDTKCKVRGSLKSLCVFCGSCVTEPKVTVIHPVVVKTQYFSLDQRGWATEWTTGWHRLAQVSKLFLNVSASATRSYSYFKLWLNVVCCQTALHHIFTTWIKTNYFVGATKLSK